jgi:uncharacterized oxidoreductase
MVTIKVQNLIGFVADVFAHAESSPEEAKRIATYLTTANLTGHDSHGVIRVPVYIRWKKMGSVVPDQTVELVVDTPSLAVVDGKFGYGQTVTPQAVKIGIEKCKKAGLAAIALRNAGHIGRVGDWAEMAAAEGLVSVHFVNAAGSLLVAPYGGVQKRLSTAPYCVGIPRKGQDPIVLDFATSIVAEGKVLVASRGGKKLPKGALIDGDGTLSEDPAVLYGPHTAEGPRDHTKGSGAIRAFGEHKGSGLAFICELLGGALTGTGATASDRRFANGMLAFYIDPKVVDTSNFFDSEISRYTDFIRATKPVAGVDSVLIPGDPERKMRADRTKNGVPLPDDTWAAIVNTAREGGGERLACDPFGVFRRGDCAMRLRQRHRRHAARRAGLSVDGAMLPGDARPSRDPDGPRALERARHDRQGARRRRLWRDLPDDQYQARGAKPRLLLQVSAEGHAFQRADPFGYVRLGRHLSEDGQR